MEYVYATLMLNETGEEINETNLTATLEAAGATVVRSRVKALVAALEEVDLAELAAQVSLGDEPAPAAGDGDDASVGADSHQAEAEDTESDRAADRELAADDPADGSDADEDEPEDR